jgi:hypothetical protein
MQPNGDFAGLGILRIPSAYSYVVVTTASLKNNCLILHTSPYEEVIVIAYYEPKQTSL